MAWCLNKVIWRVTAPLHIGWGKLGSLQRTRPYVTGRVLWGSLTMRLARCLAPPESAVSDSGQYAEIGEKVNANLAFTYFYPAVAACGGYQIFWPWEDEGLFRFRFLSSSMGTALVYTQNAAAYGTLHETEFISYRTLDSGEPVFLSGYILANTEWSAPWQKALEFMQFGGERGYGWGRVRLEKLEEVSPEEKKKLFGKNIEIINLQGERPILRLPEGGKILAHTRAKNFPGLGNIEPLVGREWRSSLPGNNGAGQHVDYNDICYLPGSKLKKATSFKIDKFGLWEAVSE